MDPQQLRGFLAVAREKSFSKGARKTFRTQSAVSLQVKALEEELGTRLFDRISPRKTELTKDGSLLLELVSPLMNDLETLTGRFNERRGEIRQGEIRISTHEPVLTYLLPKVIKEFRRSYPKVQLTLSRKDKAENLQAVLNGEVDMAISHLKKAPPSVDYHVIGEYNRVLIAPKGHPLAKKRDITLKDIAEYPLILPPESTSTRKIVDQVFRKHGLTYTLALEITGREAIKKYIELGFGVSVINDSVVSKEDKKNFFVRNISDYFGFSERGIIMRKGKHRPQYLTDFIKLVSASA